jgi:hypothetical protein
VALSWGWSWRCSRLTGRGGAATGSIDRARRASLIAAVYLATAAFAGGCLAFKHRVDTSMTSLSTFAGLNFNGWSLLATRTSFESMIDACRSIEGIIGFEPAPPVQLIVWPDGERPRDLEGNYLEICVRPNQRDVVLVRANDSEWSIALRSIDFAYSEDVHWVMDVAQRQSRTLKTTAVACYGESDCDCFVFDKGKRLKALRGREIDEASRLFDDYGISVPACIAIGDPTRIAATEQTRAELANVALARYSIERPAAVEPSRGGWRANYLTNRMIASACLDVLKLKPFVPCEVRDARSELHTKIVEIVFDPLRIDDVNRKFKAAGYEFDAETTMVIAVTDDDSILVWTGNSGVSQVRKSGSADRPRERRAFSDILGLTFPFKIKNKKAEIDAMLAELRSVYGK